MYNDFGDIMVGILLETEYASSLWGQNLYRSLIERLKFNRISYCQIFDICPMELETVFIIASNKEWTANAIKQLNAGGMRPILLCNQSENLPGCVYNCVCSDINTSMKGLLDILKNQNKTKIVLYGFNAHSLGDIGRINSLLAWKEPHFDTMQVFSNTGSLQKCFEEFFPNKDEFDAAICANDFAAVSLVKNLKKHNPKSLTNFPIISCDSSKISDYYRENIVSMDMNFEQYGRAAIYIYKALKKHPYLSEINTKVVWSIEESSNQTKRKSIHLQFSDSEDRFYDDIELSEMLIVDKLLTLSDDIEKSIIDGFMKGLSYNEIADKCFFTVGGIKYRTKNLMEKIGAKSKDQMVELLKKYTL